MGITDIKVMAGKQVTFRDTDLKKVISMDSGVVTAIRAEGGKLYLGIGDRETLDENRVFQAEVVIEFPEKVSVGRFITDLMKVNKEFKNATKEVSQ